MLGDLGSICWLVALARKQTRGIISAELANRRIHRLTRAVLFPG